MLLDVEYAHSVHFIIDSDVRYMSKMIVRVRFRGPIATRMSSEVYELKADGNTILRDVLDLLIRDHQEIRDVWVSSEQMDRDALLLRNETDVGLFNGLDTKLEDGDVLTILPLVHGG